MRYSIRQSIVLLLLVVGAVLSLTLPAGAKEEPPIIQWARKLDQVVTYESIDDPKTTLGEALDSLAKGYKLNFYVTENAFKAEGLQDVLGQPIAEKPLPRLPNARLQLALQRILDRLATPSGATFVLRRDGIEITTNAWKLAEFYRAAVPEELGGVVRPHVKGVQVRPRPVLPLVQVDFDKRPLDEALKELAETSGYNIVLDSRSGDKGRTAVTATLLNVPLDTAVRLLADMADLKPVLIDKVLYVTTTEKAAKLQAEQDKDKAPLDTPKLQGLPAGGM